ncbi:MAG: hypothetical protein IPI41_12160 [Flavobacteriales bacterium]|nr:hypothetical protein [Flavobacteriales bacterium]
MMRRLLFVLFFAISLHHTHAQLGINANGVAPAPSAMLDLNVASLVTKKGLLVPRMTTTERAAITAPAQGAVVYETTTDLFWHFNGTAWVPFVRHRRRLEQEWQREHHPCHALPGYHRCGTIGIPSEQRPQRLALPNERQHLVGLPGARGEHRNG